MPEQYGRGPVIVTGAGSGIGLALAHRLLADGRPVAAWDTAEGGLRSVSARGLSFTALDVRDRGAIVSAVAAVLDRHGAIDGLVCCAAVFKAMPFLELDEATWDAHLDVNLKGTFLCCQAVLPAMRRARRGSIVLFSSSIARNGTVAGAHYAASKGGILGLARSLAVESAVDQIRVNMVSPGITDTPQPRGNMSENEMFARAADIPLGRIGHVDDMVETVMFLLGEESSFVSAQDIRVNGGRGMI
ncbi:MAG: SDR family oxidoreductase [Alphaproteobacteria bacterium]|nr:SDR family oxidoreductase [Alphaproteobacteria bacterium]